MQYYQQQKEQEKISWAYNNEFVAQMLTSPDIEEWLTQCDRKKEMLAQIKYYREWLQIPKETLLTKLKKQFWNQTINYSFEQVEWLFKEINKEVDKGLTVIFEVRKNREKAGLSREDILYMMNRKFNLNLSLKDWDKAINEQTNLSHWQWLNQELKEMI
jgi:hypothetical protein